MLEKIEKLSKVLNESYSEKSLINSLGTFFEKNFNIKTFSIYTENDEDNLNKIDSNNFNYPIFKHKKNIGYLSFSNETEDLDEFLKYTAPFISLKIQNLILSDKMQKNINFHETMKNIARQILRRLLDLHLSKRRKYSR